MFHSNGSFIQEAIKDVTKSPYVHCALAVGNGDLIEANGFIRTREIPCSSESGFDVYRIEGLTTQQKAKIISFATSQIGTKYDYEKIAGLLIRFEFLHNFQGFEEKGHYICSGLVDESLIYGNVQRKNNEFLGNLAPGEMLTYYPLNQVIC
jgi:uncharacterized protein YycO